MSELLPCPFCGGKVKLMAIAGEPYPPTYEVDLSKVDEQSDDVCFVHCPKCKVDWNIELRIDSFPLDTIAAWNRRTQPENEPLTLSELYDIDSEPLYFHCMVGHWSLNGWHIVKAINYDGAQFKDVQLDNNDAHIESLYNYGITWLAYRHKPAKEDNDV